MEHVVVTYSNRWPTIEVSSELLKQMMNNKCNNDLLKQMANNKT
jgi:hypothetical protein